jgi:glycosyltransferase involved in cell wall biosynthesis
MVFDNANGSSGGKPDCFAGREPIGRLLVNAHKQNFVVIPAYEPDEKLLTVVDGLAALVRDLNIIVIDDGSKTQVAKDIFMLLRDAGKHKVLAHERNLGKGAALKTGFRYILGRGIAGGTVVTADADGQHLPEDIVKVVSEGARTSAAVLGVRKLSMPIPWRSFLGNRITAGLLRLVLGLIVSDTQTGLRAFPLSMLPRLIEAPGDGYEYEMRQLTDILSLSPLNEVPIQTIYEPGNPTSHFDPFFDSMKIYWVLLRHAIVSACIGALDFIALYSLVMIGVNVSVSVLVSRSISAIFYFSAMRRGVFKCSAPSSKMVAKFALNIAINLMLFQLMFEYVGLFLSKTASALIVTYIIFYTFNFLFQKYFVFKTPIRDA